MVHPRKFIPSKYTRYTVIASKTLHGDRDHALVFFAMVSLLLPPGKSHRNSIYRVIIHVMHVTVMNRSI